MNHRDTSIETMSLEFPSGPVPIDSELYIDRPPVEKLAFEALEKPGSVIRIRAPRRTGKSSLLLRIMNRAAELGYYQAWLDFQRADESIFENLDKFLRWFCATISLQLKRPSLLNDYWDEDIGSKVSCSLYFQGYLLEQLDRPLVLALNEVNCIFEYSKVATDFFALLRSWHEDGKQVAIWRNLRLVVVHSTEIYIPLNINQSPFNVGLPIKLPEFNLQQVGELSRRHNLNWGDCSEENSEAKRLMAMVGGHPYLVRLALYHLSQQQMNLDRLVNEAPTLSGIYQDHLRDQLTTLQKDPELAAAFQEVIESERSIKLKPVLAYKLNSMGLVKLEGDRVQVSCNLYRIYFQDRELGWDRLSDRLARLQKTNQELYQLVNIDDLTQLANRRYFDREFQQKWQESAIAKTPLAAIMCDIDFFKNYNDTYGHQAGDECLQKVAQAIRHAIGRSTDFAARYGGEEFIIILPGTDAFSAFYLAEKIRETVKMLAIVHQKSALADRIVTISLGVACTVPDLETEAKQLVQAADRALYQSKKEGRDRVTVSDSFDYGLLE